MHVYNKRNPNAPRTAVYVGRPSPWGNPYSHRPGTLARYQVPTRAAAIEAFRAYAQDRASKDPKWLAPLRGRDLTCWCAPLPCHAEILMELANQ